MEFVFVCTEANKTFNSNAFKIIDNNGVKIDRAGNKVLDAKVVLEDPCPFCGKKHVYQAKDLSCPFTGPSESEN